MVVVKLLERKGIIRLFGLALLLAPFFNVLMSMSLQKNIADKWNAKIFFKIIATSSTFDHALYISSILIGLIMLSGSSAAWKWVLILLGGVIANQTMNLGQNFRANWMSGPFFIVNVSIFIFILDQLAFKQKKTKPNPITPGQRQQASTQKPSALQSSVPAQPIPTSAKPDSNLGHKSSENLQQKKPIGISPLSPPPVRVARSETRTAKKILIHFAGIGPWAQLMSISKEGVHVRSLKQPPADIHSREIEMVIRNGLNLQIRLNRHAGEDYFFSYQNLTAKEIRLLNQWLQNQAA